MSYKFVTQPSTSVFSHCPPCVAPLASGGFQDAVREMRRSKRPAQLTPAPPWASAPAPPSCTECCGDKGLPPLPRSHATVHPFST